MAIGLGIGLFLIVLGIACELVVTHREGPVAPVGQLTP
jgi:hypothetical protein